FLNPPDVGGRYSALSYVGLVPAAIIGGAMRLLLESAGTLDPRAGVGLGAGLAELAAAGRDKLTFLRGALPGFGAWAEQLLAESTGKDGKGLIPVDGEPLGRPEVYSDDRVFMRMCSTGAPDGLDEQVQALEAAGHPVITIDVASAYHLGAEFLRWEIATATAGALLGVNPFDEPNVQESKDATAAILAEGSVDADAGGEKLSPENGPLVLAAARGAALRSYFAIQAFIERTPQNQELSAPIRPSVRSPPHLATTSGYGPRYLHSTGQLHKGGPDRAVFLQLSADDPEELPIPGASYGFNILNGAQALGDFRALQSKGRRVMRLHL